MTEQHTVGIVGAGVVGISWAALALAHGHRVVAYDPSPDALDRLMPGIEAAWPALRLLGAPDSVPLDRLVRAESPAQVAVSATFIQENGPEALDVKARLLAEIDHAADASVVVASSSSGLLASEVQRACHAHPERFLIGHPINPPHLIPIVEVVPGSATAEWAVDAAIELYRTMGRRPVRLRAELPGHVVNRLQSAMWREALWLVEQGVVTVAEVDQMISYGPGLRWSVLGPLANLQLSGGEGGIRHNLEHLGPAMAAWWDTFTSPQLTPEFIARVVEQMKDEMDGSTNADWAQVRDRLVIAILGLKGDEPAIP